ncbi:MAG: nitric oxide reductase activation protein NorD [Gammaproteobacteria bacterium]|nr:nitric oxide reductase activation protein NorD [Gammaproteobacteria bacterium]
MSVSLDEHRELLEGADPAVRDTLAASFAEAARCMSPRALQGYLEGAKALRGLGRGGDLVVSYLQAMPPVCREVGEDVVADCVGAAMKLASMVSGEVVGLLFSSLPTAARRLGDPELLRGYLALVHQLSAKAPRGLRPMLSRLDELFSRLTLGGLRRWALWGAQVHGRDYPALAAYFALESADSRAVLQRERRGTLFVDTQRGLNFYLRALWGRDFYLRPTSGDHETREGTRPFIEAGVIHLPDACDDFAGLPGRDLYRAAAAHAAAHLTYTRRPLGSGDLDPVRRLLVGLVEDARVEALAIRELPGLRALWAPFHAARVESPGAERDPVVRRLERCARALLDPGQGHPERRDAGQGDSGQGDSGQGDPDPWVREVAARFHRELAGRATDPRWSGELGAALHEGLAAAVGALPALRVLEAAGAPYRDDNRYLWAADEAAWPEAGYVPGSERQTRRTVRVMEMVNEVDCELAGDDAQEVWTLTSEFFRDGDPPGVSVNRLEGREPVSEPHPYPEWDYQVQLHRPDWVTVLEKRQPRGRAADIDAILAQYGPLARRIRHTIDALQPQGLVRLRRQEDGEEIDIDAAVGAMVALRLGQTPDPRVSVRYVRKTRDLAVLLLLDLSESTREVLPGSDRPVLQLAREATTLLAWAIHGIGDPFAVHGFASDGRHDVQYYRFKDFEQPWDDAAKARLAGMQGGLSTRMGAALRHAAGFLRRQRQQKKLLLLVTDGEPADIDVRDPQYLREDTRKAVEELAARGVQTFCLTLDPAADEYVARIFGATRFAVVDRVQRLPERLPALFGQLTR